MTERDALARLEAGVRRASAEIGELRKQNRKLVSRAKRLRRDGLPEIAAWTAERELLRGRLEGLIASLEKLL